MKLLNLLTKTGLVISLLFLTTTSISCKSDPETDPETELPPEPTSLTVKLSTDQVVCPSFLGFGVEWDTDAHSGMGITDADISMMKQRILWMRPPIARTMLKMRWFKPLKADQQYKNLCRVLDVWQSMGTSVALTEWGVESDYWKEWREVNNIADMADPRYAELIADCLNDLINKRNYTCIKYFILCNEPNLIYADLHPNATWEERYNTFRREEYDRWATGMRNIATALKSRGLDEKVILSGPDEVAKFNVTPPWFNLSVREMDNIIGAWDLHCYLSEELVRSGKIEGHAKLLSSVRSAEGLDAATKNKPFFLGEFGSWAGGTHEEDFFDGWELGVDQVDCAIQYARGGIGGMIAWSLDANGYGNQLRPGISAMWKEKTRNFELRPWSYAWTALSHCFPSGAEMYAPPQQDNVRVLAARVPLSGGVEGWSFCIVNRGNIPVRAKLIAPKASSTSLKKYVYDKSTILPRNNNEIVLPSVQVNGDLGNGVTIDCPVNAMVIVSSLP